MTREEAIEDLLRHYTGESTDMAIKALEQDKDYERAFYIACALLNGADFYGINADKIFEICMDKDGVVTEYSYRDYILNHLDEIDHGEYIKIYKK